MIKKGEWLLIIFNLLYIIPFSFYYVQRQNYEFLLYIGVLVLLLALVIALQRKVKFSYTILWMLSIWGLLHMMGGGVHLEDGRVLYRWIPLTLYDGTATSPEFIILKFDQILHFYIYFVMSFIIAHLLRSRANEKMKPFFFYFMVTMTSVGLSVLNELVEFAAVLFLGQTGVGGYYNTALDLVFNTMGALIGSITIGLLSTKRKHKP